MRLPVPPRMWGRRPTALAAAAALTAALLAGCGASEDEPADRGRGTSGAPRPSTSSGADGPRSPSSRPPGASAPSVAAVGDSISRGFDACAVLSDCPEVSWATGTDPRVESFASRLAAAGPAGPGNQANAAGSAAAVAGAAEARRPTAPDSQSPEGAGTDGGGGPGGGTSGSPDSGSGTLPGSWNLARSGARMADLPRQMAAAVKHRPDLITVLMGANDACRRSTAAMTPVADFQRSFERALRIVQRNHRGTEVFVASIPDLQRVWELGRGDPSARQMWGLGICPTMLARPESTAPADQRRRAAVSQRIDAYNEALRTTCARYSFCRWDGGAAHRHHFSADDLSRWDWFHPSVAGQAKLARILHAAALTP